MKRLILLAGLVAGTAYAQSYGTSTPVIWSGGYGEVLPSSGLSLPNQRHIRFYELGGPAYVELKAEAGIISGDLELFLPSADGGSPATLLSNSNTATVVSKTMSGLSNTFTNLPATGLTGLVPLANGGTNKNMTAVNGGVVWTDTDSMEVIAAGTSTQYLKSGGAGAPSWDAIDISTADITGVLPMANGGTNKNATAVNGGIVWSDADSMEITTAGTSGQVLISGGAATPTWGLLANANVDAAAAIAGTKIVAANSSTQGAVNNQSNGSFTATFTQAGGFSQAKTVTYRLVNNIVTLNIPSFVASTTANSVILAAGAIPVGLRPAALNIAQAVVVRNNALTQSAPGWIYAISNGDLELDMNAVTTAFTSGASGGLLQATSITYNLD